jgi:hypothetical protein
VFTALPTPTAHFFYSIGVCFSRASVSCKFGLRRSGLNPTSHCWSGTGAVRDVASWLVASRFQSGSREEESEGGREYVLQIFWSSKWGWESVGELGARGSWFSVWPTGSHSLARIILGLFLHLWFLWRINFFGRLRESMLDEQAVEPVFLFRLFTYLLCGWTLGACVDRLCEH